MSTHVPKTALDTKRICAAVISGQEQQDFYCWATTRKVVSPPSPLKPPDPTCYLPPMPDSIANAVVYAGLVYFAIGLLFAIVFVARGAQQIDPAAATPSLLLRLLWIPGSAAFWPMLLRRWRHGAQPPTEVTAHRSATAPERGTPR